MWVEHLAMQAEILGRRRIARGQRRRTDDGDAGVLVDPGERAAAAANSAPISKPLTTAAACCCGAVLDTTPARTRNRVLDSGSLRDACPSPAAKPCGSVLSPPIIDDRVPPADSMANSSPVM
jgi:hypothetical protein